MARAVAEPRAGLDEAVASFAHVTDDLVSVCGQDGRIKWVNLAQERVTGFAGAELVGRPYLELIHPQDRDRALLLTARMGAPGAGSVDFEARFRCKDGSYVELLFTATPHPDAELTYVVAKDLSRVRALEAANVSFEDISRELFAIVDFDSYWRRVNTALERVLGHSWDELANRRFADFLHPDDRSQVLTESGHFAARLRCKDGSYRSFTWSAVAAPDARLTFLVGHDQTEREQSAEVLHEAEERFRSAFDQAPIGMALVSIETEGAGAFLRVNRSLTEITGYSEEELVGTDFHSIAHPEDHDPDSRYVPWMLAGEVPGYEVEKRMRHADGHYIWALLTTSLVRDGQGRPLYLISQVQDITERKQAQDDVMESRARLQAIIDNTPGVVYVKDRQGRFLLVNHRFEMLHGHDREHVIGKSGHDLFPYEVAESMGADDVGVLQSGLTLEREESFESDGDRRTFLTTRFPLIDVASEDRSPYAVCAISVDITERKRAEEALRSSEQNLREIINTAQDAFVAVDADGVITAWNPQAERTFGYTPGEAIGSSFIETIVPPRHRELHARSFENFLETGRAPLFNRRVELEVLHRDGHEVPVEMTMSPVRVGAGYVFNAFLHDISERIRAEEQMRRLASIVGSSGDAIVATTTDGTITAWNRGAEQLLGYPADEAIGTSIESVLAAEGGSRGGNLLAHAMAGEDTFQLETVAWCADGSLVDISLTVSPIANELGTISGVSFIARDITERKRAERAMREVQEGFRTAFEDAPIGVAMVGVGEASGRLLQVNRSMCEITGYSAEELLALRLSEITHPEDIAAERPLAEKLLEGEIPNYRLEKRYVRKDGDPVWVTHSASAVHDPKGRLLFAIAQVEDITERKRAREELERSNMDLQQFAYAASHDLSEPLRMVSSYVQLLARRYGDKLDSDAEEFIGFALDGTVRMQALIDGLLMYSRAGTSEYAVDPVDCNEILDATLLMLRTSIEETGAEVVAGRLPTIPGDANQLAQLFQNLIGNAMKFVADGPPHIEVTAEQEGAGWHFSVSDNGIGIDPAHVERIFTVFQRLHGRGEYPGSGIGLAICKRIVERHGGRIWVESAPGEGSTFHFTIPGSRISADKDPGTP
jgi:PAS domain S-box-containing protein